MTAIKGHDAKIIINNKTIEPLKLVTYSFDKPVPNIGKIELTLTGKLKWKKPWCYMNHKKKRIREKYMKRFLRKFTR